MSNILELGITGVLNLVLMLFMPLLMVGIVKKTKAFLARRKGAPVWQVFYDIARLFKKGEVISVLATMPYASYFALASLLAAGLFIPQITGRAVINDVPFDYVIFAYLFGMSRFFSVINALQSGSSFEGMGSSRELVFSISGEITLMITIVALALFSNGVNFAGVFQVFQSGSMDSMTLGVIAVLVLFVLMLLEGCRMPIDDQATHLELTMIHEVMVLDNSGVSLAFLMYGGMLKIYLFSSIIASILLAKFVNMPILYGVLFLILLLLISKVIGVVESVQARLRMVHIHQYILFAGALAVILLISVIFLGVK